MTTSWGEALRLVTVLVGDPTSALAASMAGWAYTASRDALALADLYDLTVQANTKKGAKVTPYPRPWDKPRATRFGRTSLPQQTVRAALAARGH